VPDVMVVDANQSIRMMLSAGLKGFGFSVIESESYKEAQTKLETGEIPLVAIVDFLRNDGSAKEFISLLRDTPAYQPIKVIIATVNSLSDEEQSALSVDAVMVKPVDLSQLVKVVYLFRGSTGKLN
jgi:CheY-like chemotaxis protein